MEKKGGMGCEGWISHHSLDRFLGMRPDISTCCCPPPPPVADGDSFSFHAGRGGLLKTCLRYLEYPSDTTCRFNGSLDADS